MVHSQVIRSAERLWHSITGLKGALFETVMRVLNILPVAAQMFIFIGVIFICAFIMFYVAFTFRNFIGEAVYDVAEGSEDFIDVCIDIVDRIMKFLHAHPRPDKLYYAQHIEFMKNKHMCDPYDSYTATILYAVRERTSWHICPTVRYLYGTPAGDVMEGLLHWFIFSPEPEEENCSPPSYAAYCVYFIENWRFWIVLDVLLIAVFVLGVGFPLIIQLVFIAFRATMLVDDIFYYSCREVLFLVSPHLRRDKLPK
jgi:hypothetical protein